ncbi:MAG TPA: NmrA family NAD(P)-binding protein [Trebonia sp.]
MTPTPPPAHDRRDTPVTTTVIGATGRIGSTVAQRLLAAGHPVRVLVRNPGKARQLFGDVPNVEIARRCRPHPQRPLELGSAPRPHRPTAGQLARGPPGPPWRARTNVSLPRCAT